MLPGEMDGDRFLRALARFGWRVTVQRGSHRKLVHPDRAGFLVVAFHGTIRRPAMRKTLSRAGISEDEFLKRI